MEVLCMATINTTEARLNTHEAICAQRYEGIEHKLKTGENRMSRIEYLLYAVMAVVLLGPGVGAEFFKKLIGI
jgi:hypothetical protein